MSNQKMKSLIMDMNLLIYIHDVLFLYENTNHFKLSSTYKELYENNIWTIYKYLKQTRFILFSFYVVILGLRKIDFSSELIKYSIISIIAVIFGILFVSTKTDFENLSYQLKAKKAVHYALSNYSYQQYLYFLDNYLSEASTKNYYQIVKLKK